MITPGLDPSLTGFGWCIHDSSVAGSGRVVAKGVFVTTSEQPFIWRYMYLREAVGAVLDKYPQIANLGVETPPFGEQYSEGLYGLFLYVCEAVFTRRKDIVFFDPSRVKQLAKMDPSIRRGTMDKTDMIEAARVDSTVKRWNHNEADAYMVARSAARFWEFMEGLLLEDELTPSERHAFLNQHTFVRGSKAGKTVRGGIKFKENDRFFQFSLLPQEQVTVSVQFEPESERTHGRRKETRQGRREPRSRR